MYKVFLYELKHYTSLVYAMRRLVSRQCCSFQFEEYGSCVRRLGLCNQERGW